MKILSTVALLLAVTVPRLGFAGGGPFNVMVLYSADDPNATAVAHYYETARQLPPGHLCGLSGISATTTSIDLPTYQSEIETPFAACLAALAAPDEINYLVLVRGLPYIAAGVSLEALLQIYGTTRISDSAKLTAVTPGAQVVVNPFLPLGSGYPYQSTDYTLTNTYQASYSTADAIVHGAATMQSSFRRMTAPNSATYHFADNLFIVSSLDGFDDADAMALVDRAVASDGSMPTAPMLCMAAASTDAGRGARDPECEFTTRMLTAAGLASTWIGTFNGTLSGHTVAAYFAGSDQLTGGIAGNTFVPGAIADNLTSYGAVPGNFSCNGMTCPGGEAQTSIARFVRAGATGVHGTVAEPLNIAFPNAGTLLYYTFGYNMGESFFYNQQYLYWQNHYLGDPLATPYAKRPTVTLNSGKTQLAPGAAITATAQHANGIATTSLYIGGVQVAQVSGGSVSYTPTTTIGQTFDVYAVAVATNVGVTRTGWAQPNQLPKPDVQGWLRASLTVAAVGSLEGSASDGGVTVGDGGATVGDGGTHMNENASGGCSWSSNDRAMPWALGILLFALARAFRRIPRS